MIAIRIIGKRKCIVLVAHDNKKKDVIVWAAHNSVELAKHKLIATGQHREIIRGTIRPTSC